MNCNYLFILRNCRGPETAKGPFDHRVKLLTCLPHKVEPSHCPFYCWPSSREAVNTNFYSLWFDPTGNCQTRVYCCVQSPVPGLFDVAMKFQTARVWWPPFFRPNLSSKYDCTTPKKFGAPFWSWPISGQTCTLHSERFWVIAFLELCRKTLIRVLAFRIAGILWCKVPLRHTFMKTTNFVTKIQNYISVVLWALFIDEFVDWGWNQSNVSEPQRNPQFTSRTKQDLDWP